jgi:hypothetical protein
VPIGADATASFSNLGDAVVANVAEKTKEHVEGSSLTISDSSIDKHGVYWWEEVDQGAAFDPSYPVPDYSGVRCFGCLADGKEYTWVEYETGERELYDLDLDPDQLENAAENAAYETVRQQLEARLDELILPPLGPVCDDGRDNDADGYCDTATGTCTDGSTPGDPGCKYWFSSRENPRCDNDDDDDGDGKIDWDGGSGGGAADPQCPSEPARDKETPDRRSYPCGLGCELILVLPPLLWRWRRHRRQDLPRRSI